MIYKHRAKEFHEFYHTLPLLAIEDFCVVINFISGNWGWSIAVLFVQMKFCILPREVAVGGNMT